MLNKVILQGRLTADPELKSTPNGVSVTTFSLAVEQKYAGKGTERQTDFFNCVAWRGTAEFICRYFEKGKMMALEGTLQTRSYTDKNQNKRTVTEVMAEQVYFAGDSGAAKEQQPAAAQIPTGTVAYSSGSNADFADIEIGDDDLPF